MKCCNQEMPEFGCPPSAQQRLAHYYCSKCQSHFYKDKWYTAEEWFFYINGVTYQEYLHQQEDQLIETGDHNHELINHSNPEN